MPEEVLAIDSVGKSFGGRAVLKAASIWARPGRITTLMGRNGSGKTTMLRIAVGELRSETGIVRFLGNAYERPRLPVLARRGLYYLEERARLPTTFPIGAQLGCLRKRFGAPTFNEVIARLELEPHLQQRFDELSGGEGRRAALAAALIRRPTCLLADEPFYGIAPKDQRLIGSALRELAAAGTAIIATGHEVEALLSISDEVVWCVAGTTHSLGGPDAARSHREFVREYLGWHLLSPN